MKTVFTNDQCAHVWAQRSQSHGRSNSGNLFFEHDTIYSYGYHFPLGHFINDDTVVINGASYSISTSQHQAIVEPATRQYNQLFVSTDIMRTVLSGKLDKKELEKRAREKTEAYLLSASKRRKAHTLRFDLDLAASEVQNALRIIEAFGRKPSPAFKRFADDMIEQGDNNPAIKELKEREAAQRAKEREKAQESLTKWLSGELHSIPYKHREHLDTHLRIEGDSIRTSEGALFPVEHAVKVFEAIRAIREKGEKVELCHHGFSIRLGHFVVDTVHANGDVRAGCHFVKWPQIETCARELGIYP